MRGKVINSNLRLRISLKENAYANEATKKMIENLLNTTQKDVFQQEPIMNLGVLQKSDMYKPLPSSPGTYKLFHSYYNSILIMRNHVHYDIVAMHRASKTID